MLILESFQFHKNISLTGVSESSLPYSESLKHGHPVSGQYGKLGLRTTNSVK